MPLNTRWSATLLVSGLVALAACDDSHTPLVPMADIPGAQLTAAPSGLAAFYSFDQNAGNGAVSGAVHQPAGGYEGGAYSFDGVDDHIDLPVDVNPSAMPRVTMGAWVRVASLPANRSAQILSHDNGGWDRSIVLDQRGLNGTWMPIDGQHRVSAFHGDGPLTGPVANTTAWTFVAAVYDETSVTLYVDGQVYSRQATNGAGLSFLRVGGNPGAALHGHGEAFHGTIDNVFVYNRALTPDEVQQIRAGGACAITGTCEAPRRVAFYPFDVNAGDGTVAGAVHEPAGGYQAGAYYFDGNGAYIDLPVDVNPSAMPRMTMGAWVRAASLPAGPSDRWATAATAGRPAALLSHDDGAFDRSLMMDQRGSDGWWVVDGQYHVSAFNGAGLVPGPVASTNAWTFVAAVYDGETVALYVDGNRYDGYGSPGEGVPFLRVGGNPLGSESGEPFHGWIDNVFVVNRALSESEVNAIRTEGPCVLTGTPCNVAPKVQAGGPYAGGEGSPIALALSAADPDGDALAVSWDLGDGTKGTGALPSSHTYADNGTYVVTVTARDPSGLSAAATTTVQVSNVDPAVDPFAGASLVVGEGYTATVSFTDPGADGLTATVNYGDGSSEQPLVLTGQSAALRHTYTAPGTYKVSVTVRDDDGTTGTAVATVTVAGVREATVYIIGFVSLAFTAGELSDKQVQEVTNQLNSAGNFLRLADRQTTREQTRNMLRHAVRDLNDALEPLPTTGTATGRVRVEIVRVRTQVEVRLAAP